MIKSKLKIIHNSILKLQKEFKIRTRRCGLVPLISLSPSTTLENYFRLMEIHSL